MAIRSIRRQATVPGSYPGAANAAPIYVDSDDSKLKFVPGGAGSTTEVEIVDVTTASTLASKTLTSPIINTPTVKDLTEVVIATNVITAAETGSVFFLNAAVEFASTLPAVAAGLHFTFIVTAAPSGASYTVAGASGTPIKGHVLTNDVNSATDSDFGTAGELTLTFVDSKAVAGDRAEFWCDGTNWFVVASCSVFDAITIS